MFFEDPRWAATCLIFGLPALALGIYHTVAALRGPPDGAWQRIRSRRLVRALRAVLTGGCLIGLAYGLSTGSTAWAVTCLAIGLEELYETTMALSVLGWCERVARADGVQAPSPS